MDSDKKILQGKYELSLKNKLGSGSFAEVYKGVHLQTKEELAIKVVSKEGIKRYGEEILKALGSEVTILQSICYSIETPFIVKIFDCFETANNIYMVLEFCNNGTLYDIMKKKKKIPEKDAVYIMYQCVSAVEVLTNNNIAHRDIKPENVFVKDNVFKLGDFGFASQKNLFTTTLGTYPYMAPEIFKHGAYTTSVDVWALGVMYHEMLFGELYFIGRNHQEVANNVKNKAYTIKNPNDISKESADLLMKCMEKDPNKRISVQELKNHPLFVNIRGKPLFSPPLSLIRQGNSVDKKSPTVSPTVSPRTLNPNANPVSPLSKLQLEKKNSTPEMQPAIPPQFMNNAFQGLNPANYGPTQQQPQPVQYGIQGQGPFVFPQAYPQYISPQATNMVNMGYSGPGGNFQQFQAQQYSVDMNGQYVQIQGGGGPFYPTQGVNGQLNAGLGVNAQYMGFSLEQGKPAQKDASPGTINPMANPQPTTNNDLSVIKDVKESKSVYQSLIEEHDPRKEIEKQKIQTSPIDQAQFQQMNNTPVQIEGVGNFTRSPENNFMQVTAQNPGMGTQQPQNMQQPVQTFGNNRVSTPALTPTGEETPGNPEIAVLKPVNDDRVVFDAEEQDGILLYKLMNFRNLIVFMKETAEALEPYVEESRFCAYYLLNQAVLIMKNFLMKLNEGSLSVVQLGINCSEATWKKFLNSPLLPKFVNKLSEDLNLIQQTLDPYLQQLEGFLRNNFDAKVFDIISAVINKAPTVDTKSLFKEELLEKIKHFSSAAKNEISPTDKRKKILLAYELFICTEIDTLNFNNFSLDNYKSKRDRLSAQDLEILLEKRNFRIFMN